ERGHAARLLNSGTAQIVVGTHALAEEATSFHKLGLVIIDEQHRFGVMTRARLMSKGHRPDVLVMTATPIPRTLALTLYGDLDASVLDELPPGRTPIITRRVPEERQEEVWEFVRKQVALKRQAYIVYPIIEGAKDDQPELDFAAAEAEVAAAPPPAKRIRKNSKVKLFPEMAPKISPKAELRSATEMYDQLRAGALRD